MWTDIDVNDIHKKGDKLMEIFDFSQFDKDQIKPLSNGLIDPEDLKQLEQFNLN